MQRYGINSKHALVRAAYYVLVVAGIFVLLIVVPPLLKFIIEWMRSLWQNGPLTLWLPFRPEDSLTNATATSTWVRDISTIIVASLVAYVLVRLVLTLSNSANRSRLVVERFTDVAHPPTEANKTTSSASSADTAEQLQRMSLEARETLVETMHQLQHIAKFHKNEQGGGGLGKYSDPPPGGSVATMEFALGTYSGTMTNAPLPNDAAWVNPLMGLLAQPRCTRVTGAVRFCPNHAAKVKAITFEIVDVTTPDEPYIFTVASAAATESCPLDAAGCDSASQQLLHLAAISLALELIRRDMLNHPRYSVIRERQHEATVNNFIAMLYGRLANTQDGFCYDRAVALLREAIRLDASNYRAHANLADLYTIQAQHLSSQHEDAHAQVLHRMAVVEYEQACEHTDRLSGAGGEGVRGWIQSLVHGYTNQLILLHAARARAQLLSCDPYLMKRGQDNFDTLDQLLAPDNTKGQVTLGHHVDGVSAVENITNYRTLYYLACLYAVRAQVADQSNKHTSPAAMREQARRLLAYSLVRNSEPLEDPEVIELLYGSATLTRDATTKINDPKWYYWKHAPWDEDLAFFKPPCVLRLERRLLDELRKTPSLRTMKGADFKNAMDPILQDNQQEQEQEQGQTSLEIVIVASSASDELATRAQLFPQRWWHTMHSISLHRPHP